MSRRVSSISAPPRTIRRDVKSKIYRDLFARVSSLLPPGGRFYLQTMVFGRNMIPRRGST